ncbi:MAG: Na+/H+ antiporter NhaC, partial [Planctomycetota bacterium]
EVVEVCTAGIKAMIPAALVLIMAWSLQGICERLNTSQFLVYHMSFTLNYLPAVIFVLAAVVGFSTGSSWGTMGILIPLTIDYACGMSVENGLSQPEVRSVLAASVGAVLAGAVFGDHCSPISDTTIMSSMASGADHVDHVRTQMPYALTVAGIALVFGYLPAGFGVSSYILLPLGLAAVFAVLMIFGRKVDAESA